MAHTHGGDAKASTKKHMSTSIERTIASYRNGQHATVYDIRRDPDLVNKDIIRDKNKVVFPFVGGTSYKGQWQADKKQGFGTEMNVEGGKYEGEWLDNKRHGRGTTFERRGGKSIRQYVGDWYNGNMEGEGVFYYPNGETYKGGWYRNLQSGQGRYDYANGDYYVGEWREGKQNGFGTLFIVNGNTYEGLWMNGAKEGPGRFFYASTRKVYEGEWAEDQPRCGEYREPTAEEEATKFCASTVRSQSFGLPELALADAKQVLGLSIAMARSENADRRGVASAFISPDVLIEAQNVFSELASSSSSSSSSSSVVNIRHLVQLLGVFGLQAGPHTMTEIMQELDVNDDAELTFPEVVDVAQYLLSESGEW